MSTTISIFKCLRKEEKTSRNLRAAINKEAEEMHRASSKRWDRQQLWIRCWSDGRSQ